MQTDPSQAYDGSLAFYYTKNGKLNGNLHKEYGSFSGYKDSSNENLEVKFQSTDTIVKIELYDPGMVIAGKA